MIISPRRGKIMKTEKIIGLALVMLVLAGLGTGLGTGMFKQNEVRISKCCGIPPPVCPGSPICPAISR
jgi:hypothetical protein